VSPGRVRSVPVYVRLQAGAPKKSGFALIIGASADLIRMNSTTMPTDLAGKAYKLSYTLPYEAVRQNRLSLQGYHLAYITRLGPAMDTTTKRPLPYVTDHQLHMSGAVRAVQVIPSAEVITRLVPLLLTATSRPLP